MKSCVIIPARFKSSRFEGKPLVKLLNKEMIIWVAELAAKAVGKSNVFIATDNLNISQKAEEYGFNFIMTNSELLTGTDRVAVAAKNLNYDIFVNVFGGGLTGQADAIKQGAARALCELSPDNRKPLKTEGHLSRDPRAKERRKYGLKKARKAPQFSKR